MDGSLDKPRNAADPLPAEPHVGRSRRSLPWVLTAGVAALLLFMTAALFAMQRRLEPGGGGRSVFILTAGCALAIIASAAVFAAISSGTRASEQIRKHLAAMESLNSLSTAISGQLGSGSLVLDQLAGSAARLLGMSRAGVCLIDPARTVVEIVASAGDMPARFQRSFRLDQLPLCSRCIQTGVPVVEGDLRFFPDRYSAPTVQAFNAVSLILIPFHVEDHGAGLLTLSASEPRVFSEFDRKLAQMLGSQASVILSNARRYERTREALDAQTQLLRQRRALSAANAVIQSGETMDASLEKIVGLVPAAIGTDICGLSLLTSRNDDSVLVAISAPYKHLVGMSTGPNRLAAEAFRTRKPIMVTDAHSDNRLHPRWRDMPNAGSIVYFPMFRRDREPMGILALARGRTGEFSQEQVELGQAFSALAAVVVENTRLLEQTRSDTEAKTVLLRELNHRVKNNLTGIVALLTMNQPGMNAGAKAWLDRATDRIRAMANAHDLFSSGTTSVSIESLSSQTVSALTLARRPDVTVVQDFSDVQAALDTDKAVGVAMVLHELCYNALTHGLRGGGTLTIRGRKGTNAGRDPVAAGNGNASSVIIEITDDGEGCCVPADPGEVCVPPARGQGLELVEGLVRRELRGTFALRPRAGGGTIASVEFPVAGDEARKGVS